MLTLVGGRVNLRHPADTRTIHFYVVLPVTLIHTVDTVFNYESVWLSAVDPVCRAGCPPESSPGGALKRELAFSAPCSLVPAHSLSLHLRLLLLLLLILLWRCCMTLLGGMLASVNPHMI